MFVRVNVKGNDFSKQTGSTFSWWFLTDPMSKSYSMRDVQFPLLHGAWILPTTDKGSTTPRSTFQADNQTNQRQRIVNRHCKRQAPIVFIHWLPLSLWVGISFNLKKHPWLKVVYFLLPILEGPAQSQSHPWLLFLLLPFTWSHPILKYHFTFSLYYTHGVSNY